MSVPPTTSGPARPNPSPAATANGAAPRARARAPQDEPHAGLAFARVLARAGAKAPLAAPPRKPDASPRGPIPTPERAHGHARVEAKLEERGDQHGHGHGDGHAHGHGRAHSAEDMLDPAARQAAMLAPPVQAALPTSAQAVEAPRARMSLEELMPMLVRRIAWAGDKHKGTVRLEIGAGAYAGATLLVHADGGRVRVEVSGVTSDELRARIDQRLRRHGLDVESVT